MKKSELMEHCQYQNILLDDKVKYTNQDLIKLLGQNYVNTYSKNKSFTENFITEFQYSLSKAYSELSIYQQDSIWTDKSYIAEYKFHGLRALMVYDPIYGFRVFGRDIDYSTFLYKEYTHKLYFIKNNVIKNLSSYKNLFNKCFVLDIEIVPPLFDRNILPEHIGYNTNPISYLLNSEDLDFIKNFQVENPLKYVVLDIIHYDQDLRDKVLEHRKVLQTKLVKNLSNFGLPFIDSPVFTEDFKTVFDRYVSNNGEGLVFKHKKQPYVGNSRSYNVQVKVKPSMLKKHLISDLDVFISKIEKRKNVIELTCSVLLNHSLEEHVIGICKIPTQEAYTKDLLSNKVITVSGYDFDYGRGVFDYVKLLSLDLHKDKNSCDCIVDLESLNSQVQYTY